MLRSRWDRMTRGASDGGAYAVVSGGSIWLKASSSVRWLSVAARHRGCRRSSACGGTLDHARRLASDQRLDLAPGKAAMATERDDMRDPPLLGPPADRLGRDVEERRRF